MYRLENVRVRNHGYHVNLRQDTETVTPTSGANLTARSGLQVQTTLALKRLGSDRKGLQKPVNPVLLHKMQHAHWHGEYTFEFRM